MKQMVWVIALGVAAGMGYWLWFAARRYGERKRAAEERFAGFIAQTMKPAAPKVGAPPTADLGPQKLLFDAAAKAGEAGEPALSIQLYARLIARYPNGALVAQARAAVEAQKSRLAKSKS